uniref:C2 domain-containing protein n=1 Tax=Meloidogyne hapla TaxID=6305 RepID=A0A1I8B616_MELHA
MDKRQQTNDIYEKTIVRHVDSMCEMIHVKCMDSAAQRASAGEEETDRHESSAYHNVLPNANMLENGPMEDFNKYNNELDLTKDKKTIANGQLRQLRDKLILTKMKTDELSEFSGKFSSEAIFYKIDEVNVSELNNLNIEMDAQQGGVKNVLKDWPAKYREFDTHNGLSPGYNVRFLVKVDPVADKDFTVKFFKVNCVLSDEFPQRCFSKELGEVYLPPRMLNATPIPNVVYEAFVDCKLFVKNDDGSRVSAATQVEIRTELVKLIRVKPLQSKLYSEHVDILRICPWNTSKVASGEIKPQIIYWDYGEEGVVKFNACQDKPPFPTRALSKVRLWYFENNRVIRARWPKTLVKITLGMEKMMWECISVDSRLRYPPLNEGQFFFGWIVYNEFISCYYVQNYRLSKEGEAVQNQLEKRIVIDSGNPVNEYSVRIRESPLHKNFYICDPFENILIADPKFILRNVSLDAHRVEGCPVWVRLEPEHGRLAHFSISELNKSAGEFSASEKMMSYPNICGIGLIIDLETNTIFSENHPQKRILLSNPDMFNIKIGHFFYFSAAYWPLKQAYLIGNYQLISTSRRKPIDTFYIGNKLIVRNF